MKIPEEVHCHTLVKAVYCGPPRLLSTCVCVCVCVCVI